MQQSLTPKELLFCALYARLLLPKEAAIQAGFSPSQAQNQAVKLLAREDIRREIRRCLSREAEDAFLMDAVKAGLFRLAFSSAPDAALLISSPDFPDHLNSLDLFSVSEIKAGKNGVEIKFADRLRALEQLWEITRNQRLSQEDNIYQALLESAQALARQENSYGKD